MFIGAGEMNRTPDLLITNELLYRLSYTGISGRDYSPAWYPVTRSTSFLLPSTTLTRWCNYVGSMSRMH